MESEPSRRAGLGKWDTKSCTLSSQPECLHALSVACIANFKRNFGMKGQRIFKTLDHILIGTCLLSSG